jgi:hypothetical protein
MVEINFMNLPLSDIKQSIEQKIDTGYWIEDDFIWGPKSLGEYWISDGFIWGPKNGGQYRVENGCIYGPKCSGQFVITEGHIYGPCGDLPWFE